MEIKIIFIIIITAFISYGILSIWHRPNRRLNQQEKEIIKQRGLIHITSRASCDNILKSGYFMGKISLFEKDMGELVWFYIADEDECNFKHKKIVQGKNGKNTYEDILLVTEITDNNLNKMKIRRGKFRDNAVVYIGDLFKPNKLERIEWR